MTERVALVHVYNIRRAFDGSIQPAKRGMLRASAIGKNHLMSLLMNDSK